MKAVGVFLGASAPASPRYADAARRTGRRIAERGLALVYGGGRTGLMGVLADAALAAGGRVVGVIPQHLVDREVAHPRLDELLVVTSMAERKALMAERSDAFVALPGGFGTLDELFEMVTWTQLGVQAKACGLLNVAGFYDPLLAWIEGAVRAGLVRPRDGAFLLAHDEPDALLDALAAWAPPGAPGPT